MADGEYYYCLDHKKVEPYDGCRSETRLGPYPTQAEAEHALQTSADRNEAWDNDPNWNDDEDGDGQPDEKTGWGPFKS